MIARLIGGFVAILIGVSILPMIADQVKSITSNPDYLNATAGGSAWGTTMLNLIPGFFALAILGIGIAVAWGALRNAGLMGGGESDLETRIDSSDTHHDGEYIRVPEQAYTPTPSIKRTVTTNHKEYQRVYTDSGGKFD